ncbi:hypothetical protein, partial [Thiolapillus sp.]|uniref:hypothetical protein n=1 Tax=Thiolapillus sp. TaxID=2017437 RepID=UPI003AF64AA0
MRRFQAWLAGDIGHQPAMLVLQALFGFQVQVITLFESEYLLLWPCRFIDVDLQSGFDSLAVINAFQADEGAVEAIFSHQ